MKPEDWDAVIATNLTAVFRLCKASVRRMMKERRGRIVNLTSVVGLTGNAGQVNYAAAKAGLLGFTKSLAKELASRNITVNAVAPGFIDTDMTRALDEGQRAALLGQIPLARLGTPEDVAARGAVPRLPAVELHHRGNAARERRHVHALAAPGEPLPPSDGVAVAAAAAARRSHRPGGAGCSGSAPRDPSNRPRDGVGSARQPRPGARNVRAVSRVKTNTRVSGTCGGVPLQYRARSPDLGPAGAGIADF